MNDVQKKSIPLGVGLDYKDGIYSFINEYADIHSGQFETEGKKQQSSNSLMTASGNSIDQLVDNLYRRNEGEIFFGAIQFVLFTEGFAKNGIESYMNRIRGIKEYRQTMFMAVTGDPIQNILNTKGKSSTSISFSIDSIMQQEVDAGMSIHVYAGDILSSMAFGRAGYIIPYISKESDEIILSGYVVMDSSSKMIGLISAEERKGLVYILGEYPMFPYYITGNGNNYNMIAELKKKRIKPKFDNGKVGFDIDLDFILELRYTDYSKPVDDTAMKALNTALSERIKKDVLDTIQKAQKQYRCDYFNFYKYFRAKYADELENMDWNNEFSKAAISVNIKSRIRAENLINFDPKK